MAVQAFGLQIELLVVYQMFAKKTESSEGKERLGYRQNPET